MLNFIRFDIAKMFRTRSFYIIIGIVSVLNLAWVAIALNLGYGQDYSDYRQKYSQHVEQYAAQQEREAQEEGQSDTNSLSIAFSLAPPDEELMDEGTYKVVQEEFLKAFRLDRSTIGQLARLTTGAWIFFAIFLGNDFSSGYLKNLLTMEGSRRKWLFSKIITALVFGLVCFVVSLILGVGIAAYAGVLGHPIHYTHLLGEFLLYELYFVLIMAVTSLFVLFSQSKTVTVILAVLMSVDIFQQGVQAIGSWFHLDLSKYLYSKALAEISFDWTSFPWSVLALAAVYILAIYLINQFKVQRMDFRL